MNRSTHEESGRLLRANQLSPLRNDETANNIAQLPPIPRISKRSVELECTLLCRLCRHDDLRLRFLFSQKAIAVVIANLYDTTLTKRK